MLSPPLVPFCLLGALGTPLEQFGPTAVLASAAVIAVPLRLFPLGCHALLFALERVCLGVCLRAGIVTVDCRAPMATKAAADGSRDWVEPTACLLWSCLPQSPFLGDFELDLEAQLKIKGWGVYNPVGTILLSWLQMFDYGHWTFACGRLVVL